MKTWAGLSSIIRDSVDGQATPHFVHPSAGAWNAQGLMTSAMAEGLDVDWKDDGAGTSPFRRSGPT
ncbi:hypothetical protein LDL36_17855 [Komagataeibacter sp. FNDCR1]|nr:hypothetical protein [Komagataeibacter sp. FNDCR1]